MTEKVEILYKGEAYCYKVIRSNNNNDRVDFLLQPATTDNRDAKRLINANELWFTWRKELRQFFTTNAVVALHEDLFNTFCHALMKHYVHENNSPKFKVEAKQS